MVSASSVIVPNHFLCPLTLELMVDPVKTDCNGTSSIFFQCIYPTLFSKSSFGGHVFVNRARA